MPAKTGKRVPPRTPHAVAEGRSRLWTGSDRGVSPPSPDKCPWAVGCRIPSHRKSRLRTCELGRPCGRLARMRAKLLREILAQPHLTSAHAPLVREAVHAQMLCVYLRHQLHGCELVHHDKEGVPTIVPAVGELRRCIQTLQALWSQLRLAPTRNGELPAPDEPEEADEQVTGLLASVAALQTAGFYSYPPRHAAAGDPREGDEHV